MKTILHVLNYAGYYTGLLAGGTLFSRLWWGLWKFASDEDYASNHPKMYLLKFFAVFLLGTALVIAIVWWPLTKLMEFIDSKIDKTDKEDFDVDDEFDFLN